MYEKSKERYVQEQSEKKKKKTKKKKKKRGKKKSFVSRAPLSLSLLYKALLGTIISQIQWYIIQKVTKCNTT